MWRLSCAYRIGTALCLFAREIDIFRKSLLSFSVVKVSVSEGPWKLSVFWREGVESWEELITKPNYFLNCTVIWLQLNSTVIFLCIFMLTDLPVEVNLISKAYWHVREKAGNSLAVFSQELWEAELGEYRLLFNQQIWRRTCSCWAMWFKFASCYYLVIWLMKQWMICVLNVPGRLKYP